MLVNINTLLEIDDEVISYKDYYDIQVYSSIRDHLPILSFKLKDHTGVYWKELNFSVGSKVRVFYVGTNGEEKQEIYPTTKFIIKDMYDGFELNNNNTMSGFIQVNCVQAWSYYEDSTPHAYNCQKIGDLIKSICKNAKSGAELNVIDENFSSTSDSGSIRYKVGCSDYEFITQMLLPFTMVDASNSLFYVDRMSKVHLSGFNTLYSASPKTVICPDVTEIPGGIEGLKSIKNKLNLESHANYVSIEANIAQDPRSKDQLKQRIYIYDHQNESTKIGIQTPGINSGADSDKVAKSFTPIKDSIMRSVDSTSSFYIANRTFEEQIAAARNTLSSTNNLLSIPVYIGTFYPNINIGDTVYLWIPSTKSPTDELNEDGTNKLTDKAKTHWLSGKWLISSEAIITGDTNTVGIRYTLIRPTFDISKESTSLADYRTFYKVK